MGRTGRRVGVVTVRPILSKALMDAVAGWPDATLAASIYAAPEADRREVAIAAALAGLWVHADVIVTDRVNRGVDLELIRDLATSQIGPLDIHLIIEGSDTDRLPELIEEVCSIPVSRITVPLEAVTDIPAVADRIRAAGAAPWLAIAPATDPGNALIHRAHIDGVLVMLIQPGTTSHADETISHKAETIAPHTVVGVDGGVNRSNLATYLDAGASYIVSGRGLLANHDPGGASQWTQNLIR